MSVVVSCSVILSSSCSLSRVPEVQASGIGVLLVVTFAVLFVVSLLSGHRGNGFGDLSVLVTYRCLLVVVLRLCTQRTPRFGLRGLECWSLFHCWCSTLHSTDTEVWLRGLECLSDLQ